MLFETNDNDEMRCRLFRPGGLGMGLANIYLAPVWEGGPMVVPAVDVGALLGVILSKPLDAAR
jgi:hypothetical protein